MVEERYATGVTKCTHSQTGRKGNKNDRRQITTIEIKEIPDTDRAESSTGNFASMWWADLKAAIGQWINVEGLLFSVSVITRNKKWVMPHLSVRDIRYIDWAALRRKGYEGVVFDKDNTLTAPYSLALWGPLAASVESYRSVFGNNIVVFSNSAGLEEYDPDGRKARALEYVIGIRVIRHILTNVFVYVTLEMKKPAGSAEEIEKHFGCDSSKLIMVGDRPFTDIVYGNGIFVRCDNDRDGALSDAELKDFQVKCFNAPLQPSEIMGVKRVVQEKLLKGVNENRLTLTGFLFLHALFIEKGRLETTWTVLRKFGYNNDIRLNDDKLLPPSKTTPDQSLELTSEAMEFLKGVFSLFDSDGDRDLNAPELEDLFSTAPEGERNALGGLSLDGFLSKWALMTLLNPVISVENLIYIGYAGDPSSAVKVTRRRKVDHKKQQSDRTFFQCFVFGPKEAGKSELLHAFVGRMKVEYISKEELVRAVWSTFGTICSEWSVVSLVGLLLRIGPEDPGKPAPQRWHATPAFDLPMAGIEPTASQETPPWWVKPRDASRSSGGSNSGPPTESPEPLPPGQAIICTLMLHNK
ncbi:hypothetical protein LXL04_013766 [Taraxacum kok-saghyz]